MKLVYIWSKIIKKLPMCAIKNSVFERPSKVEARSTVVDSTFGKYSYCGYGCTLIGCEVGRFTSISDNVVAGLAEHPMNWVSTSPAFYYGKDSIPKNLARFEYSQSNNRTFIGHDVWIGEGVRIKTGVKIGNGAIVGMGSVVTKDVEPYCVVAGNPARVIKYRFSEEVRAVLNSSHWWDFEGEKLEQFLEYMNNPEKFIEELKNNDLYN